ncbi:hypothetical protein C5C00_07465 [Rathayibacter rathayi]|nr:hypothetical protein C5C47_06935 [Rathayibacter rathayi]PPG97219.1 hypothetical protein C5C00_07465 [Rathayibacter rathayi]
MTAVSGQAESERRRRREFTEWREREAQREQAAADPVRMRGSMGLAGATALSLEDFERQVGALAAGLAKADERARLNSTVAPASSAPGVVIPFPKWEDPFTRPPIMRPPPTQQRSPVPPE